MKKPILLLLALLGVGALVVAIAIPGLRSS
jgi:hypothetical protein